MKKAIKVVAFFVVITAFLSWYGHIVRKHVNDKQTNPVWVALNKLVSLPQKAEVVIKSDEVKGIPATFKAKAISDTFNLLKKNVYGLGSVWNDETKKWDITLFNFRNDSVLHKWTLEKDDFHHWQRQWPNSEPRNPILLANRGLITSNDESHNLWRLDSSSKVVWHSTSRHFHHSMNLSADGNIWVCTMKFRPFQIRGKSKTFRDDFITKVNVETGEILFDKSVSEIFIENGLSNYVFGFKNQITDYGHDPFHLNDIQPALKDGKFWKKDDLFLSLRHRDVIVLYRPSTNKILRLIQGEFIAQHDVDIISDSTISIFNNNASEMGKRSSEKLTFDFEKIGYSEIMIYNFNDSSFSSIFENHLSENRVFTSTQGFQEKVTDDMWYVEDYDHGVMYIMNEDEVLYKNQLSNRLDSLVENPHWVRLYENIDF